MSHPVIHFEIVGGDGKSLQKFYAETFGWKVDANNPMNYGDGLGSGGSSGIGGGITGTQPGDGPATRIYIEANDLQAALDKVEKSGGKTVMPPEAVPGGPEIAMFSDPEGNVVGLVKTASM